MFKGTFTAGTYASGYIPFTQIKNTNSVFNFSNGNQVAVTKSGIVDVKINVIVQATGAANITAQLYGNNAVLPGSAYTITAVSGDTYTLVINDAVVVSAQSSTGYATLGVQLDQGCTIVGGNIVCQYRQ